jgi:hypothetical protein
MNYRVLVLVVLVAAGVPSLASAQQRHRIPAKTVGHPLLHHGAGYGTSCGCGTATYPAAHGCNSCRPGCPPIIPAILNGVDRLVRCLLPCHRIGCGGCGSCMRYNGCCGNGGGVVYDQGVIIEPKAAPAAAAPAKQTYYNRRGQVTPRYQQTRSHFAPPARRISVPRPAAKPAAKSASRTRTVSRELKPVDSNLVQLQPAPKSRVRTVVYEQSAKSKSSIRNPLRD